MTRLSYLDNLKALATRKNPEELLFFASTANGKSQAKAFIKRLKERTDDRDKAITVAGLPDAPQSDSRVGA